MFNIKFILVSLLALSFNANAYDLFSNDRKGIWITPKDNSGHNLPHQSGDTVNISGTLCAMKWHNFSNNPKCKKLLDDLPVKAYFPDATTEVTNQVVLTKKNGNKEVEFSFTTPALIANSPNLFTIVVGNNHDKADKLLNVQAKLNKRILTLKERLIYYQNKPNSFHGRPVYIEWLTKFIADLERVSSNINKALEENPNVLAQMSLPLQVDNKQSGNFYYSSTFSGMKLAMLAERGLMFEGEKINVTSKVTNLSHLSFWFPRLDHDSDDDSDEEDENSPQTHVYSFKFDGNNIFTSSSTSIPFGESKSYVYNTPKLTSHDYKMQFEVKRLLNLKWPKGATLTSRWGSIDYEINTLNDNVNPTITSALLDNQYFKEAPEIMATIQDNLGRIDNSTIKVMLNNLDVTNKFNVETVNSNAEVNLTGNLNPLTDGLYVLSFYAKDSAQNSAPTFVRSFYVDKTAPQIFLAKADNILTNQTQFGLPITVLDNSPTQTTIFHNGVQVLTTTDKVFTANVALSEGFNQFEVVSTDSANNIATPVQMNNVFLDTIAPTLNFTPIENATVFSLAVNLSGTSSELLSTLKFNGQDATLDNLNFTHTSNAVFEGNFLINGEATDLAGNLATFNRNVNIVLKVLNQDLISISPHPTDNGKLIIIGAPYASRPGAEITLSSGFFNSETVISNADGSFEVTMDFFTNLKITGEDEILNREEIVNLSYNVDTTLSGTVKDIDNNPLPGVEVMISGSGQTATTNASGVFIIPDPATGDQTLTFDGTKISETITGPNKKYSKIAITVALGTRQQNVLDRPIYLAPLMFDGTETIIPDANTSVTVTSPHAEGVELRIPAGVATFPDGSKVGKINMIEMDAQFTSIETLEFARPTKVIALEPSGTTFSEPIEVTFPNVNELPPGVQVVVISKNSLKGIWEIDGLAKVSEDGQTVKTIPGGGLTHFSETYISPIGPTVKQIGSQDRPGTDVMNGSLTTSIELPSYKSMGQDVAPSLSYKSSWASPLAVVTNLFDVPRQEFYFQTQGAVRGLFSRANVSLDAAAWIEPDYIEAQFYSEEMKSEKMRFTGVPNKSVISYGMDLSARDTGVQLYNSHYDVRLKQIVIGTIVTTSKKRFGKTRVSQESFSETRKIEKVFPSDIGGPLFIQNYKNSSAGQGWRVAGASRLYNINDPKMMLENSDGSIQSFSVNDQIETLYKDPNKQLTVADFTKFPNMYLYDENTKKIYDVGATASISTIVESGFQMKNFYGEMEGISTRWHGVGNCPRGECSDFLVRCTRDKINYKVENKVYSFLKTDDDFFAGNDKGSILKNNNVFLSGTSFKPSEDLAWELGGYSAFDTYCPQYIYSYSENCYNHRDTGAVYMSPSMTKDAYFSILAQYNNNRVIAAREVCKQAGFIATNTGDFVPQIGFEDGPNPRYSSIYSMAKSPGGELVVADFGNNRVRKLNIYTNTATTIAGNGQTYDTGFSGQAVDASIYHPRGIAYDGDGNLYVSTERGFIKKVSPTGIISHYAGKSLADGAVFSLTAPAEDMLFNSPYGLTIDNVNKFLYVADTIHNRVVRIDMITKEATTVAGDGTCSSNAGDSRPAIEASICAPEHIGLDDNKNLLILDRGHNSIRRVVFQGNSNTGLTYLSTLKDQTKITKLPDSSFELSYRNGSKVFFNQEGLQTKATDRVGREVNFYYDSQKHLTSMVDAAGRAIAYQYSGGKLVSITDPANRVTSFSYDDGKLTEVEFPDGSSKEFSYNEKGLMTSEKNQNGHAAQYFYNQWNRLTRVLRPDGNDIEINDFKSATMGNNYTGGVVGQLKTLGQNEVVDGIKDARDIVTTFTSNEDGYVSSITDGKGQVTKIERDIEGRPIKITRPDNTFVTFIYDQFNGDLLSKTDSSTNASQSWLYNNYGQLLSRTNSLNQTSTKNYDNDTGLLISEKDHLNRENSYEYNVIGLITKATNSQGKFSEVTYDALGNAILQKDTLGKITNFTRDPAGNITHITNPQMQLTQREFDLFNRLKSVTSPKNEKTEYLYSNAGELLKIKDPKGKEVFFEYNNISQMVKKTDQLGRVYEVAFDPNGNVTEEKLPGAVIKNYEYDNLNQLSKKTLPDDVYEMDYDVRGNMTSIKNKNSELQYEYEHLEGGDVVATATTKGLGDLADFDAVSLSFDYNVLGQRSAMQTPVGNFSYSYDSANRMSGIQNHKGENFSFSFDSLNRLEEINRPGSKTNFAFDDSSFLTSIIHKNGATTIAQFLYERDEIGNRTQMRTPAGNFDYGYDDNNQLISATNPESVPYASENFTYDNIGNRTNDALGNYIYDLTGQRLEEDYKNLYLYDQHGNITSIQAKGMSGEVTNYSYSSENQLIGFKKYVGATLIIEAQYSYDAIGRRIERKVTNHQDSTKSFNRRYVYDGSEILFEMDSDNKILATYTHSTLRTDDVLAIDVTADGASAGIASTENSFFYVKDALGSITDLTNSNGTVVQHYGYSSFGKLLFTKDGAGLDVTEVPVIKQPFTYTNREIDWESELYYNRMRNYNSISGRFLQTDPYEGQSLNPQTVINRYIYGLNNPISNTDPTGEFIQVPDVHGNYCGNVNNKVAYDENGEISKTGNPPSTDRLDNVCYKHDIAYSDSKKATSLSHRNSTARLRTDADLSYQGLLYMRHKPIEGAAVSVFGTTLFLSWSLPMFAISSVADILRGLRSIFR